MPSAGRRLPLCQAAMRARPRPQADQGFTLMELITVMVVLAILTAIAVPMYGQVREQARRTRAKAEVRILGGQLRAALDTANSASTVGLTGKVYTAQDCRKPVGRVLKNLPKTDPCWVAYLDTLEILRVTGGVDVAEFADGDPWGSPYLIDENEGEAHSGLCYRQDTVTSAGRDGIYRSPNDDIEVLLPRRKLTRDC